MDEGMPRIERSEIGLMNIYVGLECFHENIVWKHVNLSSGVDLVLDKTLPGGVQNDRPSRDLQMGSQRLGGGANAMMTGMNPVSNEDEGENSSVRRQCPRAR